MANFGRNTLHFFFITLFIWASCPLRSNILFSLRKCGRCCALWVTVTCMSVGWNYFRVNGEEIHSLPSLSPSLCSHTHTHPHTYTMLKRIPLNRVDKVRFQIRKDLANSYSAVDNQGAKTNVGKLQNCGEIVLGNLELVGPIKRNQKVPQQG